MENLLKQFKALSDDEKIAFMKEAMVEMMPFCMNMMKSKGMDVDRMSSIMKNMMGWP
jgi:hypothetical protein